MRCDRMDGPPMVGSGRSMCHATFHCNTSSKYSDRANWCWNHLITHGFLQRGPRKQRMRLVPHFLFVEGDASKTSDWTYMFVPLPSFHQSM